jgi:DNA-binding XRE family transcriptional regulator
LLTPAARISHELLYLFAVFAFDEVTDIDHAVVAAVGSLVGGVWAGRLRYTGDVHSWLLFLWAGSRGVSAPAGPFSLPYVSKYIGTVLTLLRQCARISLKYGKIIGMFGGYTEVDGAKLKKLREEQAFSVRDLADEAGVSTDTIIALEKDRRKGWPRNVRKLALALGVEPRELMKGSDDA